MTIYICGATETRTRWRLSRKLWLDEAYDKVYVPCCNRNAPLHDTVSRFETAFGGYIGERYFKCAARRGCNKNPGYKRTAHLRYFEFD